MPLTPSASPAPIRVEALCASSGARTIDDEHFAGSGILTVRHGNGGTLIRLQ